MKDKAPLSQPATWVVGKQPDSLVLSSHPLRNVDRRNDGEVWTGKVYPGKKVLVGWVENWTGAVVDAALNKPCAVVGGPGIVRARVVSLTEGVLERVESR